jgi:hypothetical protein
MSEAEAQPQYVSVAGLKARGWTDAAIRALLQAPDKLADNPYYKSAAPTRLYLLERVQAVEASDAFTAAQAKARPRKAAATRAVHTKRSRLLEMVQTLQITVPRYEQKKLTNKACEHYNRRRRGDDDPATPSSALAFLERITVNYLRHELTSYEDDLERVFGQVGVRQAYAVINAKVYDAIAAAYPHLAEECARQQARKAQEAGMREAWRRSTAPRRP